MKKSIILLSAYAFISVTILSGCGMSSNDVENNRNKVTTADDVYQSDVAKCTSGFYDLVHGNDTTFTNFEFTLEEQNKDSREDNEKKLDALKLENNNMENRLGNYKEEGKEKWMAFKVNFNAGMDSIAKEYRDLAISNDQTKTPDVETQTADNTK